MRQHSLRQLPHASSQHQQGQARFADKLRGSQKCPGLHHMRLAQSAHGSHHSRQHATPQRIFGLGTSPSPASSTHSDPQQTVCRHVPRLLESLSPGTMDKEAVSTAVKPSTSFVSTSDRYAVVPDDPYVQPSPVPVIPLNKRARV